MIECPICSTPNAYQLRFIKLLGARTGKYNPMYFCKECYSFFQRPDYHEDDKMLEGDLQWHLARREYYRNHSERILNQVTKLSPNARTLLDIGCGIGTSILKATELGLTAQGIEPNPYAVRYAKDNLSLNLIPGYFSADLFNAKFDIIIVDNVLEHVPVPRTFIRDVFAILNRGGILFLAVPGRSGGFLRVLYSLLFPNSKFNMFVDNDVHINHFSRKSILRIIEPYGATLRLELYSGAYIIQAKD
jgi:SAM-dependent methyltransferase